MGRLERGTVSEMVICSLIVTRESEGWRERARGRTGGVVLVCSREGKSEMTVVRARK